MKTDRPYWYEEDAVYYTSRGRHPKLPEKYKYCILQFDKYNRKYRSFLTREHAWVVIDKATDYKSINFTVFKCQKCGFFHIIHNKNYEKLRTIQNQQSSNKS